MITPSWRICLDRWIALDAVCTTLRLGELAEPTPDRDVIRVHEASGRRMKRAILNAHTRIKSATGHSLPGFHRSYRVEVKKAIMNAHMRIKCATSQSLHGLHRSRRVDVDRIECKFVKQRCFVKVALLPLSLPIIFRKHLSQGSP
jgi:hypothetical protein